MFRSKCDVVFEENVQGLPSMIGTFDAVDDRAPLDGDPSAVGFHLLVAGDAPDGQVNLVFDDIAGCPRSAQYGVALF